MKAETRTAILKVASELVVGKFLPGDDRTIVEEAMSRVLCRTANRLKKIADEDRPVSDCGWQYNQRHDMFETGCNWEVQDRDTEHIVENYKVCPYCTGKIVFEGGDLIDA